MQPIRIPLFLNTRRVWRRTVHAVAASVALSAACWLLPSAAAAEAAQALKVDGNRAMAHARKVVGFGPRVSGSPAIAALRRYILAELRKSGLAVEERNFDAQTPAGVLPMVNIVAKAPGGSGRRILLTGHYDTKRFSDIRFVGANDAGSSTALLLELAAVLSKRQASAASRDEIWIVFFDGEEAVAEWTDTDSLYGSRRLADEMRDEGKLESIRALINLDMIGDRDLSLVRDYFSDAALRDLAIEVAAAQGHKNLFDPEMGAIEDDHVPFAKLGTPVLDLIDFNYGPSNSWWHTKDDTLDKLSPKSFETVGNLVLGILDRLQP